jgi:hypothetical protein
VAGKLEKAWVEADHIPDALEHDGLQIVVKKAARNPFERDEGGVMAAEKALDGLIEHEAGEERPRERKRHHEARQPPARVADGDGTEAAPVDLTLLAGQNGQAKERFVRASGSHLAHVTTERPDRAAVAAPLDHLKEARGSKSRMLLEGGPHEVPVRIEQGDRRTKGHVGEALRLDCERYGVTVHPELGGDRADLPVLGVVQAPDASAQLRGDHRATSLSVSWRRSLKSPKPRMSRCR